MDERRFDSLVRSLASGTSRRSMLKGILGFGGAALTGGVLLDQPADAARRPSPAPKPVTCPGRQTPVNGVCTCPGDAPNKCGPDCCTGESGDPPSPTHSECCDNACCFGACYGEELCCSTNPRPGERPPLEQVCISAQGKECCPYDDLCCSIDGCCETVCFGGARGNSSCCATESFCPGDEESVDRCCGGNATCCDGGTTQNACVDLTIGGTCCDDSDCGDPCQQCNHDTHTCEARCDVETEVCCTGTAGHGQCVTGECCVGLPGCGDDKICCAGPNGTTCEDGPYCGCDRDEDCPGCQHCDRGTCNEGCPDTAICCGEECKSSSEYFTCSHDEGGCCPVADACCNIDGCCSGACYGGESGRDFCCNGVTEVYCEVEGGSAQCCPDAVNEKCCGTVGCCTSSRCNEEANICCSDTSFACGTTEGNQCCDSATEHCCNGVCCDAACDDAGLCPRTCDAGSAPNESGICASCPTGTYSGDGTACVPCAPGTFNSSVGNYTCLFCPVGSYSDAPGSVACTPCAAGTYNDVVGNDTCTLCPAGSFAAALGATQCTPCDPGNYNDIPGNYSCYQCEIGTYAAESNSTACTPCAVGTYGDQTGASTCSPCSAGTYTNVTGQTGCLPCDCGAPCNPVTGQCPTGGNVGIGGECTQNSDCTTGICGCGAPVGFPDCICRADPCFAQGADCSSGYGAAWCCAGDCNGNSQNGYFCISE